MISAPLPRVRLQALGTTAIVSVTDAGALDGAERILRRELDAIDRACSRFRADSELVALNARPGTPVPVGELLFEAIRVALSGAARTGGLVSPTVGRALRLAGYDRSFELIEPSAGRLHALLSPVPSWRRVVLDPTGRTVRIPAGGELDLGATAKALAADRAAAAIARVTGAGVLVSLGGDIAVAGEAPAEGWPIRLADRHDDDLDAPGPTVEIRSGGLATSSVTVRRWGIGREQAHHIVDPRSGRPALAPWRTVSVAAASCVDANLASTAAVILGDRAGGWLERRRLPARLVAQAGDVATVGGWPEDPR